MSVESKSSIVNWMMARRENSPANPATVTEHTRQNNEFSI